MIPNFSILSPLPEPGYPFFLGRGQIFLAYCGRCVWIGARDPGIFSLYMDPLTNGGGPGSELRVPPVAPPPPHMGPCQ